MILCGVSLNRNQTNSQKHSPNKQANTHTHRVSLWTFTHSSTQQCEPSARTRKSTDAAMRIETPKWTSVCLRWGKHRRVHHPLITLWVGWSSGWGQHQPAHSTMGQRARYFGFWPLRCSLSSRRLVSRQLVFACVGAPNSLVSLGFLYRRQTMAPASGGDGWWSAPCLQTHFWATLASKWRTHHQTPDACERSVTLISSIIVERRCSIRIYVLTNIVGK